MIKQLYYSEMHSKNIEIYLSKLYIGKVQSTGKNIVSVNSGHITNYVTCAGSITHLTI